MDLRGNTPGRVGAVLAAALAVAGGVRANYALDEVSGAVRDAEPGEEISSLVAGHSTRVDDCTGADYEGGGI